MKRKCELLSTVFEEIIVVGDNVWWDDGTCGRGVILLISLFFLHVSVTTIFTTLYPSGVFPLIY